MKRLDTGDLPWRVADLFQRGADRAEGAVDGLWSLAKDVFQARRQRRFEGEKLKQTTKSAGSGGPPNTLSTPTTRGNLAHATETALRASVGLPRLANFD